MERLTSQEQFLRDKLVRNSIKLYIHCDRSLTSTGSGFIGVFNRRYKTTKYLVTANHVVEAKPSDVAVLYANHTRENVRFRQIPGRDIALAPITTHSPAHHKEGIPIAHEWEMPGEELIIGYPGNSDEAQIVEAKSVILERDGFQLLHSVKSNLPLGMSGSPIINRNQQAVGLAVVRYSLGYMNRKTPTSNLGAECLAAESSNAGKYVSLHNLRDRIGFKTREMKAIFSDFYPRK